VSFLFQNFKSKYIMEFEVIIEILPLGKLDVIAAIISEAFCEYTRPLLPSFVGVIAEINFFDMFDLVDTTDFQNGFFGPSPFHRA
jgi:hypothetical protein